MADDDGGQWGGASLSAGFAQAAGDRDRAERKPLPARLAAGETGNLRAPSLLLSWHAWYRERGEEGAAG